MKIVREHINFERGLEPKEAMGIGIDPVELIKITTVDDNRGRIRKLNNKEILDMLINWNVDGDTVFHVKIPEGNRLFSTEAWWADDIEGKYIKYKEKLYNVPDNL